MGLVDYSDSESEIEVQPKPARKEPSKATNSRPFQKFVDRSNPGKILVNLPTAAITAPELKPSDEPPAKRAKTTGGSRFSGFGSFLPPPKTASKPTSSLAQGSSSNAKPAPRPGVHLKTGAEPAFSREQPDNEDYEEDGSTPSTGGVGLKLPPPKQHSTGSASGPSIPADQIPAEEVKLVGKPLMFKPLSVSRKPVKKKTAKPDWASTGAATKTPATSTQPAPSPIPEPPKKKISLFSLGGETATPDSTTASTSTRAYEPLFSSATDSTGASTPSTYDDYSTPTYTHPAQPPSQPAPTREPQSLSSLANTLNLTPQARRELFGRAGQPPPDSTNVINFDMSREYDHNETIRQAGEAVSHNPVRSIKSGKHSLRQLVNAVQGNASALEESFAAGKGKRSEAGKRYGW